MEIKTKEEALNYLIATRGETYKVEGVSYQYIWAALPDGYNKSYPGFAFLQGFKNLETGKIENTVFGISVFPDGEYRSMNRPLSEDQILSFDIDWEAGTAKERQQT